MGSNVRFGFSSSIFLICVIVFLVTCVIASDDYRVVETKSGALRGFQKTSLLKKTIYYAFKGIPYAKPPIDELRFKPPEPVEPWAPVIRDAFEHSHTCLSLKLVDKNNSTQSEDCLSLNVYVPSSASADNKLAVMFFIHGGGYIDFSGNEILWGADFLIEQNVILVTINYRLAVMGFLTLDTPEYSGNMGLKDQQLALKWTYENIEQFFGDRERITIFGESSGGSSTHFQVLSNESRKYFRNAIVESGTAETVQALSRGMNHVALVKRIAKELGKPTNSMDDLIQLLKTTPGKTLATLALRDQMRGTFAPVIEKKDTKKPFMIESPHEIYKTSNITRDVIFYHTSNEALGYIEAIKNSTTWEPYAEFTLSMPFNEFNFPPYTEEYYKLSKLIRTFYFSDQWINARTWPQLTDNWNDVFMFYPTHKSIKHHQEKANTFYIRFSVNSTLNSSKRLANCMDKPGAAHADEACYVFRSYLCEKYYSETLENMETQQSEINLRTIEYITKLFSNFAKYGEPTYKDDLISSFHPIKGNEINFLDITNEGLKLDVNPRQSAMEFWSRLENHEKQLMDAKNKKNQY